MQENNIGKIKNTLISAIKNANFFPAIKDKCGGNFRYTEKGIKDCTNCQLPHKKKNYGYVTGKYQELADLMRKIKENNDF